VDRIPVRLVFKNAKLD
jgi:hypothetical protein